MYKNILVVLILRLAIGLAGLVESKSNDVGVDHAQVEWGQEQVRVGKRNEHGVVGHWVALVNLASRLVGETRVVASNLERSVGQVELVNPCDELRCTGRGGGHVGVIGSNSLSWQLPGQVKELAGERKRFGAVASNARGTRVAGMLSRVDVDAALIFSNGRVTGVSDAISGDLIGFCVIGRDAIGVGLVVDVQDREILPCETSGVLWA